LYSDDLGDACVFLMEGKADALVNPKHPPLVNVGTGEEYSIGELAEKVRVAIGASARIAYDTGKPDGMPRKVMDVSRLASLGWRARISLEEGLKLAYSSFLNEKATA
jgi:GDP-L-fucose synthase